MVERYISLSLLFSPAVDQRLRNEDTITFPTPRKPRIFQTAGSEAHTALNDMRKEASDYGLTGDEYFRVCTGWTFSNSERHCCLLSRETIDTDSEHYL